MEKSSAGLMIGKKRPTEKESFSTTQKLTPDIQISLFVQQEEEKLKPR
jgi:hypothetical protein